MLLWNAAKRPERVLQSLGERDEAFAAEHDMGMFEAGKRKAEVIEPMIERQAGDGDAKIAHVGKVGLSHPAWRMLLAENHLPVRPVHRSPCSDAALQRPPHLRCPGSGCRRHSSSKMAIGRSAGRRFQHGDDLALPNAGERIEAPSPARLLLLRGKPGIIFESIGG